MEALTRKAAITNQRFILHAKVQFGRRSVSNVGGSKTVHIAGIEADAGSGRATLTRLRASRWAAAKPEYRNTHTERHGTLGAFVHLGLGARYSELDEGLQCFITE